MSGPRTRSKVVLTAFCGSVAVFCSAVPARADALLPTVALISPITVLLLLPVIAVEAWFISHCLKLHFWKATKVMTLANVVSTIMGIPITLLFTWLEDKVMEHMYGSQRENFDKWMATGDPRARAISFGHYPVWAFLSVALATLVVCFLMSWWVEYLVARWRFRTQIAEAQFSAQTLNRAVRNANLLSYSLLTTFVMFFFSRISFPQF